MVFHDVLHNCCPKQWARISSSSMVAHYLAQFLQPSCTLLPKTETGVSQFTPADVLCHFNKKGGFLHTLTELFLSVILPDFYFIPLGSTTSLLKIFSVYLVIFFSSSSHSFTIDREEISSQKDSLTCTLRPQPPLPITCLRKPSFLSKILHFIVGTSNAVSAAMLEKCLGYFKIFSPTLPEKLPTLPPGPQSECVWTCTCVHAYSLIIGA